MEKSRTKPNLYLVKNKDKKRQLICPRWVERLMTKKVIAIEVSDVSGSFVMMQLRP